MLNDALVVINQLIVPPFEIIIIHRIVFDSLQSRMIIEVDLF